MSGLRYRVFLFYNAIGGLVWGIGYTLLGYVVGLSFERILREVGLWSVAVVAGIVVVAVAVRMLLKRRERKRLTTEFDDRGDRGGTRAGPPDR
jgi:membrane protein DedA with SNARE-associated domain